MYKYLGESQHSMTYSGRGEAYVFNSQGFFLTANHVVQTDKPGNMVSVLYDPISGIARTLHILAYSEKFDIALGKIDVPDDYYINPVRIAKCNPDSLSTVVSLVYDSDMIDTAFRELMNYGNFNSLPDSTWGKMVVFDQDSLLKKQLGSDLGLSVSPGQIAKIVSKSDYLLMKEGEMAFTNEGFKGDSGSPVFSLSGNYVCTIKEAYSKETGISADSPATVFITPDIAGSLVRFYINQVKAYHQKP